MDDLRDDLRPERIRWLPPLVCLVNCGMVGLLVVYTMIDLKPILPPFDPSRLFLFRIFVSVLAVLLPMAAGTFYLQPVYAWLRNPRSNPPEKEAPPPRPSKPSRGGGTRRSLSPLSA